MNAERDFPVAADQVAGGQPRLRVLHVVARMPPAGTEHQLAGMLRVAHGRYWDATLCVLHAGGSLTAQVAGDGVPVIELAAAGRHPATRALALRRLTRSGQFDVVHSSLWGANAFTRAAAMGHRRPAMVASERRVEDFRPAPRRSLDRALRPLTDAYIGNSPAVVEFVVRAHEVARERVHLVPNGIDRDVFRPVSSDTRGRLDGPCRIGALGRLVHQKGFDVLIAALPKVLAEHDVEVCIAGQGELRDALGRQAADLPVRFVGLLDSPGDVADYLRGLDLFVMPSRYEGLPNAVLEAAACGVPVVATDAPGVRSATGQLPLVPPDDPHALADAVIAALRSPPPAPTAAIPTFAQVADAHLAVFTAAIARRAQRRLPRRDR